MNNPEDNRSGEGRPKTSPLPSLHPLPGSAVEGALPCPFCGGSDIYWSDCRNYVTCPQDRGWRRIVCRTCGSGTTDYPPDSHQDCLTRWNTRILTQNTQGEARPHEQPERKCAKMKTNSDTLQEAAGAGSSPSLCSPVFPLRWEEMWDEESEYDNHLWEAPSPYHDDGSPFMFRIRQRLREDKHEFYEASDAEVMMDEDEPRSWETLDEAKAAMQKDADDIVNSYRANNQTEAREE